MSSTVPMHPEATDDPAVLRWVIPADVLAARGVVEVLPAPLAALHPQVVAQVQVQQGAVLIRLAHGHSWREQGAVVRTALAAALSAPQSWEAGTEHPGDDAQLRVVTERVLAGRAGEQVRSHGGSVEILDVSDGVVTLRMGAACTNCPAVGFTLRTWIEREIRAAYPALREVRAG